MENEKDIASVIRDRIAQVNETIPNSIGAMMDYRLVSCDPEKGDYTLTCRTFEWMRNYAGTLHGGMCATVLDQAMGFISYCLKAGEGTAPTVQLEVDYHRPLIPGEEVLVKIHVISITKSLMNLTAEAMHASNPEKVCLSGSGIYFFKPAA